jgi:hypothetical protein
MTASMKELLQQKLRVVRSKLDKYPQLQELEVSSFRTLRSAWAAAPKTSTDVQDEEEIGRSAPSFS